MFGLFRRRYRPTLGSVASHAALGAVAGLAGTWVMGKLGNVLYEREDPEARRIEDRVRFGGQPPTAVAADKIADLVGAGPLADEDRDQYSQILHYGIGAFGGGLYGAGLALAPNAPWWRGLLYGLGFFLIFDEGVNPMLGLSPGAKSFPWQAHARGLAGHLVFGVTTDLALRTVERPALRAVGLRRHVVA